MAANPAQFWIVKPSSSSQGKGIFITNNFADIVVNRDSMGSTSVASHYISNPLLIDQLKFDLRVYVALTSVYPLKIYVYDEGLVRFATTKYRPPEASDPHAALNTREAKFTHLTNYSLNKLNKKGFKQGNDEDGEDGVTGSKWSLKAFRKVLRSNGIDDKAIFKKIYDIINKTFLSVDPVLRQAHTQYVQGRSNCFQLFGFDILVDNKLNPWLLEVNLSPSLACESPLDQKIKSQLITDLFNMVGIVNHLYRRPQKRHGAAIQANADRLIEMRNINRNMVPGNYSRDRTLNESVTSEYMGRTSPSLLMQSRQ